VFYDTEADRSTLEICVYRDNTAFCEGLFGESRQTLTVEQYMLKNKTETAFQLASADNNILKTPTYIEEGIAWITA